MPHTKKKAGILGLATAIIGAGVSVASNGMYIEAGAMFAIATGLFLTYEHLNIQEVDFAVTDAERIAETVADGFENYRDGK